MYEIFNDETQCRIKDKLTILLNQNFKSYIYQEACLNNIIKPSEEYEEKLFIELDKTLKEDIEQGTKLLNYICGLLGEDKIIKRDTFKNFLGKSPSFDFVFDMKTFDYKSFDLNFLSKMSEENKKLLRQLLQNQPEVKSILIDKFKILSLENIEECKYKAIKNILLEII